MTMDDIGESPAAECPCCERVLAIHDFTAYKDDLHAFICEDCRDCGEHCWIEDE